jgi:hypothetical protein
MEMGTKPIKEHEWLNNLVGNWKTESQMTMPDGSETHGKGNETQTLLGGLWVLGEGAGQWGEGKDAGEMQYRTGLGYDVSFKGYRGFWLADMSSHLWKYEGELSADGKVMTLSCEGPDMVVDGKTANYRDVITIVDKDHRRLESFGQDDKGEWAQFMTVNYTRV